MINPDSYLPKPAIKAKAGEYTPEQRQAWRTPNTPDQPVLWLVSQVLGVIELDPTSDDDKSVPAISHFTKKDNCLIRPWQAKTAFMNCPFDFPDRFLTKLALEYYNGRLGEAIILNKSGVYQNQSSGETLEPLVSAICLWGSGKVINNKPVSRLSYLDHQGFQIPGCAFDSTFGYIGDRPEVFAEVFGQYGSILRYFFKHL